MHSLLPQYSFVALLQEYRVWRDLLSAIIDVFNGEAFLSFVETVWYQMKGVLTINS